MRLLLTPGTPPPPPRLWRSPHSMLPSFVYWPQRFAWKFLEKATDGIVDPESYRSLFRVIVAWAMFLWIGSRFARSLWRHEWRHLAAEVLSIVTLVTISVILGDRQDSEE